MLTYYTVQDIESEAGWGQKVDEVHYFRTKEEAVAYIKQFNSRNTETTTPSWYMRADGPYTQHVDEKLVKLIVEDSKKSKRKTK